MAGGLERGFSEPRRDTPAEDARRSISAVEIATDAHQHFLFMAELSIPAIPVDVERR